MYDEKEGEAGAVVENMGKYGGEEVLWFDDDDGKDDAEDGGHDGGVDFTVAEVGDAEEEGCGDDGDALITDSGDFIEKEATEEDFFAGGLEENDK